MTTTMTTTAALIEHGCTRMTRGGIDRLYFGTEMLGEMAKDTKNFLNLKTGEVWSTAKDERKGLLEEKMREIIAQAESQAEPQAQAQTQAEEPEPEAETAETAETEQAPEPEAETAETAETQAERAPEAEAVEKMVTIEAPSSYQQVLNLENLIKRYSYLLTKATGFKRIEIPSRDKVIFWGMDSNNPAHCKLVELMVAFATAQRKIMERETLRPENEKFTFRTWLIRLGWTGREDSKMRTNLYKGLEGNSAFCTATSKARWEQKHGRKQEDWDDERNWVIEQERADCKDYWNEWDA